MCVNAHPFQKRATAGSLVGPVTGTLNSLPSNVAMVRWVGSGLTYTLQLIHGKPIVNDVNGQGGVVAITKRSSAMIGGQANVLLYANGNYVGTVSLATYYSGAQPTVSISGGNFQVQTVTANGSTALILAYQGSSNSGSDAISYPMQNGSPSYNAYSK